MILWFGRKRTSDGFPPRRLSRVHLNLPSHPRDQILATAYQCGLNDRLRLVADGRMRAMAPEARVENHQRISVRIYRKYATARAHANPHPHRITQSSRMVRP